MTRSIPKLVLSTAFLSTASAILVAQDSPCAVQCGNVLSSTSGADVLCSPDGAATAAGIVYQNCIQCELQQEYSNTKEGSDLQWLLYNSRWSVAWCLFGDFGNQQSLSDLEVCTTSRACGTLQDSFEYANMSTTVGAYDYCSDWDSDFAVKCESCLSTVDDGVYLSNYVLMLDAACQQTPAPNGTLYVAGNPFSSTPMVITTPTPPNPYLNLDNGPISLGGKVGIAVGGVIFLLALIGFCIVCNGRRRRRNFLHKLEMQHKDQGWPHPAAPEAGKKGGILGGKSIMPQRAEVNDTPLSQKPLRGWDDSPQSATTNSEQQFGRYYSPYSSQYNSPVNGNDGSGRIQQWPTFPSAFGGQTIALGEATDSSQSPIAYSSVAQERAQHSQGAYPHDGGHLMDASSPQQARGQQPIEFGLAVGGSQSTLRTQPSHGGIVGKENESPDSYEMYDVGGSSSSNNSSGAVGQNGPVFGHTRQSSSFASRMARIQPSHQQQAPMLQHPGYGRYSPDKKGTGMARRTSGLTEEDAKRGDAL